MRIGCQQSGGSAPIVTGGDVDRPFRGYAVPVNVEALPSGQPGRHRRRINAGLFLQPQPRPRLVGQPRPDERRADQSRPVLETPPALQRHRGPTRRPIRLEDLHRRGEQAGPVSPHPTAEVRLAERAATFGVLLG